MNEICGSKRYFQFIKWRPSGRPLLFLFHKSTFARIMQGSIYLSCMYIIVYMCIFICLCNYIFSTYIQIHQNKMFLSLTWQTFFNHLKFDPRRFESSRPRGWWKIAQTTQRDEEFSNNGMSKRSTSWAETKTKHRGKTEAFNHLISFGGFGCRLGIGVYSNIKEQKDKCIPLPDIRVKDKVF